MTAVGDDDACEALSTAPFLVSRAVQGNWFSRRRETESDIIHRAPARYLPDMQAVGGTDDDRPEREQGRHVGNTMSPDADRIAQLEAEMAEAQHQLFKADSRHDHDVKMLREQMSQEMCAHERTKAREQAAQAQLVAILATLREEAEDMRSNAMADEGEGSDRLKLSAFALRERAAVLDGIVDRSDVDVKWIAARVPLLEAQVKLARTWRWDRMCPWRWWR